MTNIIGILNVTPDSFSDAGMYHDPKKSIKHLEKMLTEGADIIDIGGYSTRPGAENISEEEEWKRIQPILQLIKKNNYKVKISIDSFKPNILQKALEYGIYMINDVSGVSDAKIKKLAAESACKIIFMHSVSVPADKEKILKEDVDVINFLTNWQRDKIFELSEAGIKKENMIFDPGIGFGKTNAQNLSITKNISSFRDVGIEVLVGHSEKSFLSRFTSLPAGERNVETQVFSYILASQNVDYLRVHDVAANVRATKIAKYNI